MTEQIWIALIGGLQAVTLGLLGLSVKHGKDTKDQVKNTHTINLRDDLDEKHRRQMQAIARIEGEMSGVKKDVGRLDDRDVEHGKHHERVDRKLDEFGGRLNDHLRWSREFVTDYEKEK